MTVGWGNQASNTGCGASKEKRHTASPSFTAVSLGVCQELAHIVSRLNCDVECYVFRLFFFPFSAFDKLGGPAFAP